MLIVYVTMAIVVVLISYFWVNGITNMHEKYPNYKAEEFNGGFDFDDNSEWDVTLTDGLEEQEYIMKETKFKVGDKAIKTKGYEFPCTIVSVFETVQGNVRVVGEMDGYGLLHIFNEDQLERVAE